jgi:hypothetical protein
MNFAAWLRSPHPSAAEIRSEIWKLGGRHLGRPLEGALAELKSLDLAPARARLLRACVLQLQR